MNFQKIFNNRIGLLALLGFGFILNWMETQLEGNIKHDSQFEQGYAIGRAFQSMEGGLDFSHFESLASWAIYGFSFSYFLLFPLLILAVGAALTLRKDILPFRIFVMALAINYAICIPFFIFFPVPERWALPSANTILLSDILSTQLIQAIRPFSGLDNSFPSVHVSFTVILMYLCYRFRVRFKHTVFFLGLAVILSTFALGIHWIPDILMGIAVGILSGSSAELLNGKVTQQNSQPSHKLRGLMRLALRKTTFISYRRETGSEMARIVQSELSKRGFSSFLDVDDLGGQHFGTELLKEIEAAPNFVVVLSPGCLDRCRDQNDWLRREIAHAIDTQRNIVPILIDGFDYPPRNSLPVDVDDLINHNGVSYSHEYFAATFDKLVGFLKKR